MTNKTKTKTVTNLEAGDCRWPYGDPRHADFHFCGAKQMSGRPYCSHHWSLSFIPGKSRHGASQMPIVQQISAPPATVPALPNRKAA